MRIRKNDEYFNKAWHLKFDHEAKTIATIPIQFRFKYVDGKRTELALMQIIRGWVNTSGSVAIITDSKLQFQRGDKILFSLRKNDLDKWNDKSEIVNIVITEDPHLIQSDIRQRKNMSITVLQCEY